MTPSQAILNKLTQHKNTWVNLIDLHHISSGKPVDWTITALIEQGHRIERKTTLIGKMHHVSFRLNVDESQPELL